MSGYTDKLAGQSIVISGVFAHHSRDEYKDLIEKNGGKNVGSISAKTSFILPVTIWASQTGKSKKTWSNHTKRGRISETYIVRYENIRTFAPNKIRDYN